MTPRRLLTLTLVITLGTAGLAGCGDDVKALSKEEFLKQGNAICAAGNERLGTAFTKAFGDLGDGEQPDPKVGGTMEQDVVIPVIQGEIDDIRALKPPKDLADDVNQLADTTQAALDQLKQLAKDDPAAAFQDGGKFFSNVPPLADKIGLTECAK